MGEKRVIEEQHVNEVYNDDYALKDSATNDTTAILWSDIKAWINSGMATESDLDNAIANFASEYSTSTSYAVGDFCVFDGVLYECVGATTGDWDSTKWEETTVGEVLTDNSDGIAKLVSSIATEWRANESYSNGTYVMYEGELYVCFVNGSTVGQFKKNTEWLHRTVNSMVTKVIRMIAQRFYASTVSPPSITPYSKGDLVWYSQPYHEDELYICKQDLPNGDTEWVPEHWDKVTDISGLSKYLMDKIAEAGQIDDVQVKTTGDYESVVDENKVAKIDLSNVLIEKSVPNLPKPIATFNDGSDLPLKSLTASIVPVQSGSGDPSPTNVRPISGWTEEVITRTGKNLFDKSYYSNANNYSTPFSNYYYTDVKKLKPNTTYTISCTDNTKAGSSYFVLRYYSGSGADISNDSSVVYPVNAGTPTKVTFTTGTEGDVRFGIPNASVLPQFMNNKDYQLEEGSTATTYEPYAGTTTTIPFTDSQGQSVEVFGGSVDVVNGGEQQRTLGYVDLGTLSWSYNNVQRFFYTNLDDIKLTTTNLICDRYIYVEKSWTTMQNGEFGKVENSNQIRFHNENYTTAADFKTAMSGVQLVYELATPTTFYTQPTSIKSLDGVNNVSASTGDVTELEYIANATDVIANLEARVTALENQ